MKKEGETPYKKGLWTVEEDKILMDYVKVHGKGQWNKIAKKTGLKRCGKSCRLRWMNYLSPNVKKGNFSDQEEDLIIRLHKLLGNRWSMIAKRVPGRTDNQVKNYWNSHLSKKLGINHQSQKQPIDFCQFSQQLNVCDETAIDPSHGESTIGTIDQSCHNASETDQLLNYSAQGSGIGESFAMMNTNFWNPGDDLDLSSLTMMDCFDEYSPFGFDG